jgi:hypothetical protein
MRLRKTLSCAATLILTTCLLAAAPAPTRPFTTPKNPEGKCTVTLVDEDAKPLAGADLIYSQIIVGPGVPYRVEVKKIHTDATGKASFDIFPTHAIQVQVCPAAEGRQRLPVPVPRIKDPTLTLTVPKITSRWSGVVTDTSGKPISNATVTVNATGGIPNDPFGLDTKTDEQGRFQLPNFPTNVDVLILIDAPNFKQLVANFNPRNGKPDTPSTFKMLAPGSGIHGTLVVTANHKPPEFHEHPRIVFVPLDSGQSADAQISDGAFRNADIAEGQYRPELRLSGDDRRYFCSQLPIVTIAPGRRAEIKIELTEGIAVHGKINGKILNGTPVLIYASNLSWQDNDTTANPDGTFTAYVPKAGNYEFFTLAEPTGTTAPVKVHINADKNDDIILSTTNLPAPAPVKRPTSGPRAPAPRNPFSPTMGVDAIFAVLADDNADAKNWLEAANRITLPNDVTVLGEGRYQINRRSGVIPPMKGEPLRTKTNPSVLDLMTKRAAQISTPDENGSEKFAMSDGCDMALYAAKWDPKNASPVLAAQVHRTIDYLPDDPGGTFPSAQDQLVPKLGHMTVARVVAGDRKALDEYAKYMVEFDMEKFDGFPMADALEPICRYPNEKSMQDLAEQFFLKSPKWAFFLEKDTFGSWAPRFLVSPILGSAAFRQSVIAQLSNEKQIAVLVPPYVQPMPVTVNNQWLAHFLGVEPADPLAPKAGEIPVRFCDVYAAGLTTIPGMPWVAWYWPAEKKDAARALMIARLKQYGPRFEYSSLKVPGDPENVAFEEERSIFGPTARLTFAKLGHPATKAEVEKGQAIFSLEGLGQTRVVPLDNFPARAKWTLCTEHPTQIQTYGRGATQAIPRTVIDRSGLVWQAEEVLQNGVWTRFYGFVGQHTLQKVPADQIEFLKPNEHYFSEPATPTATKP